jgi:pimeloyl-ACP methyl ester carboxylesterase
VRVKALVLFAPFARFTEDEGYKAQPASAVEKMKLQLDRNPAGLLKSFNRRMGFTCDIPEGINPEALRAGLDALLELDFRNILSDIDIPIFIVSAGKDLIVNSEMSDLLAKNVKGAKRFAFEEAGHAVPFTHANESVDLISKFLKEAI